jgi:hypothetical protein
MRRVLVTTAFLLAVNSQAAIRVPLSVQKSSGIARVAEPVRSGVPVPRSEQLFSTASLRLLGSGGTPVPARFTVLGRWNAGPNDVRAPVRWVLVDFLADNRWGLAVGTRDFWRKGPQRLAAAADGTVTVEFPSEAYRIYQAMGLMEEVLLNFHPASATPAALRATMVGQLKDPLFAVAPPAWYVGSGAFGELSVAPSVQYPRYDQAMEEHCQQTLAWIDEGHAFGLLNWLDMPSDRWDGALNDQVTWGNSYYDAPQAGIREFARRGEFRWLRDLAFPQIRHCLTTDCFDFDEVEHRFNGISMMRGPHRRTVITGEYHYLESLWDYYYLTGDRRALKRGLQAARSYANAGAWENTFDGGLQTGTLTLRIFSQKLNTLVEAVLANGDNAVRAKMASDAEDFMTFVASPEGSFKNSRATLTTYNSDQAFMVVVLAMPAIWKCHQLTGSPQAREKLTVFPQRILRAHRMSADPASPDYTRSTARCASPRRAAATSPPRPTSGAAVRTTTCMIPASKAWSRPSAARRNSPATARSSRKRGRFTSDACCPVGSPPRGTSQPRNSPSAPQPGWHCWRHRPRQPPPASTAHSGFPTGSGSKWTARSATPTWCK